MSILVEKNGIFHLQTKTTSYVMAASEDGYLTHVYWGKKIHTPQIENADLKRWICFDPMEPAGFSLDFVRQEFPTEQNGDYRMPALKVEFEDGSRCCPLTYVGYQTFSGKQKLEGLPAVYCEQEREAETLELYLMDEKSQLSVTLRYCVMEDFDVITRNVILENKGKESIRCNRVSSISVDFESSQYDMIRLPGGWGKERRIDRAPLHSGMQNITSRRGASSHQMNPFLALLDKSATETTGDVYGINLVYSGNFHGGVEVSQIEMSRMYMGLGDDDFSWLLQSGESFVTPEVVMVYSGEGLGGMSRTFHKLYRKRLVRGVWRDKERPILINNWEATYFDFDENKIVDIAKQGAQLGLELMVLDDGWFGNRNDDRSSLGDWFVNREKLPCGIDGLAKQVEATGMKFGLWVEPEMVSVQSKLYEQHPDWCIHIAGRNRKECRNQLTLDLSRQDVCDYLINTIGKLLEDAPISYVKWDMNRHMSNLGSALLPPERQREMPHRYMLGLYRVMEAITSAHPNVLFESCSGGGGRFDAGMLYYMPQTWTSDDTDPVERLFIQYGTSLVYPISTMGAHVSASPNHQSHRVTSLKMRGDVAMSGNFGYELDLTAFTEEEKDIVKKQVEQYKELRTFVQTADMYRLSSPFEGNTASWMFLSENKKDIFAAYFRIQSVVNPGVFRMKLQGLDPNAQYEDIESKKRYYGDELMEIGLVVELWGDYQSCTWRLKMV